MKTESKRRGAKKKGDPREKTTIEITNIDETACWLMGVGSRRLFLLPGESCEFDILCNSGIIHVGLADRGKEEAGEG